MQIRFLIVLFFFIVKTIWGQSNEININHANTFISLARENGNDEYYLDRAIHYLDLCETNSKSNPEVIKQANSLRKEIEIAKTTSENNLNYQIEFYQLFTTNPVHFGFANDPIEYAFGNAFEKLLHVSNPEMGNKDVATLNSYSLIHQLNCDDEITEVNYQFLWSNSKHVLIPKSQYSLSDNFRDPNSSSDTHQLNYLCEKYKTNSIGIFETKVLDEVDGVVYVSVSFCPYYKNKGFGSTLYTEGFGEDKRGGLIPIILFLLISSVIYISILAVGEEVYDRISQKLWHQISIVEFLKLFKHKLLLVGASQILPTALSFIIVNAVKPIAPDLGTHYLETESMLWVVFITISMSIIPTLINVFVINRLDIDGFHSTRGYQNFANASIYGSYFSFFYFYGLKYGEIAHEQHFLLIIVTFIIGLVLGKSLYLYLNKRDQKSLFRTSILGFALATLLLIVINLIILKRFDAAGFLQAMIIAVVSAIGYLIFEKKQNKISKKLEEFSIQKIAQTTTKYISQVIVASKLDYLMDKLTNLQEDKLNVVVLTGPSGIGKTSFINEYLTPKLVDLDKRILYGDCNEIQEENEIHFEPFVQAFSKELGIKNFVNSREQISNKATILQPLLDSAPVPLAEKLISNYSNATKTLKEHCFATALELEKKQFKGVLVIEDLQWIDAESREFLSSFIKIISNNTQFRQLKSNLSILLTIRESSSKDQIRGIAEISELHADLGSQIENIDLIEVHHHDLFDYEDFIDMISKSDENSIFTLADSSRYVLNNLINQKINSISVDRDSVESLITPHYIFKLLSQMIEDKTLIPSANGLILTKQITEDDLPNNDEIDKFYHTIFDKIESTPTIDRIQWIRILESAAMIGQKFDAAILATVWGIDLLQLLDFLERMEKLGLVYDIYQEDNVYHFQSNKVTAALKSYFGSSNAEVKQIILEYNKRWINVQNKEIQRLSNLNLDKLSALYRRLKIVKHVEGFDSTYELVYTIYVLRIIEIEDYDKLKVIFKNETSYLTKYLKAITHYFESEVIITGSEANELANSNDSTNLLTGKFELHSTKWYIQHFVKAIIGKFSDTEWLTFIDNCKSSAEPIFLEIMFRLVLNSENLIQKRSTQLLDTLRNLDETEDYGNTNLIILKKLLEVQILINPYCELPQTSSEIENLFTNLKDKLETQSSFFLWSKYYEVKLNYFLIEEEESKQIETYFESTKLLWGNGGTKFWANFILRNHPESILLSEKFNTTIPEVEKFLSERGWLDELSDIQFRLYLLKIKFKIARIKLQSDNDNTQKEWALIEKTIRETKDLFSIDKADLSNARYMVDLLEQEESLYYYRGNFDMAIETCSKAIEICKSILLLDKQADLLIDRNLSHRRQGKLENALDDVKTAMDIIKKIGNLPDSKVGVSIFQYGQILREVGKYEEAMVQYNNCQQYWAKNIKGAYRKMITEMIMIHCISQGKLKASDYFPETIDTIIKKIQLFFTEPSNRSRLTPVNLKNLEDLKSLTF